MRTVVLVGTDHKFQKPIDGPHRVGIENFKKTIRVLFERHNLCAIAEEMSPAALQEANIQESVAQQVCAELGGLPHNFSDPTKDERRALGILDNGDMMIKSMDNDWSREQLDSAIHINMEVSSRVREREWMRRIQEFDEWPLLFICGANHFTHFAKLLRESGLCVIEAYPDWGPIIEVMNPTPLYSNETNLQSATLHHCLSWVKRATTRQLLPDEKVTVMESTCGKDFWAFKIAVEGGTEGWLLDVDGGINITFP